MYAWLMRILAIVFAVVFSVLLHGCGAASYGDDRSQLESAYEDSYKRLGTPEAYAFYAYGELLVSQGDPEGALTYFVKAHKADSSDPYLRVRLAACYLELGKLNRAERLLEKAVNADPSDEYAWLTLARLHGARGDDAQKVAAATRAMREEPEYVAAALWLASEYEAVSDHRRAREILERAVYVEGDMGHAEAHLALGKVSLTLGDLDVAQNHLTQYIELRPHRADVIAELSTAYLQAGEKTRSAELMALALSKDPSDVELRYRLIHLFLELGQHKKATHHLRSLPPVKTGDQREVVYRTCLLAKADRLYEARDFLVSQLGLPPENEEARIVLAELEGLLGRLEAAGLLLRENLSGESGDFMKSELKTVTKQLLKRLESWPESWAPCSYLPEEG